MIEAGTVSGPFIDRLLVALLCHSRRLLDVVAPLKSVGEIHGLPKPYTDGAGRPEPIIFREQDPSRDFGPWWLEKTGRIHGRLFELAEKLDGPRSDTDMSLIRLSISEILHLSGSVIELLNEDLRIREVRFDDADEDEECGW